MSIFKGFTDLMSDLGNVIQGVWNDWTGNTANRENLQYQQDYNQEVFNRADTQYQRTVADLRAAGLSSQLAAGSPSTVAGASQAPSRTVGNESAAIEKLVGIVNSIKQTKANVNLTNAQTDLTNAQAKAYPYVVESEIGAREAKAELDRANSVYTNKLTEIAQVEGQTKAAEIQARIENTITDTKYKSSLISLSEKQGNLYKAQTYESGKRSNLYEADYWLTKSQTYESSARTGLYKAQTEESGKRSENLDSSTALNYANKDKVRKESMKFDQEIKNLQVDFANKVKSGLHLDAQTSLLLQQACNAAIEQKMLEYNYDYSYRNGLRTTDNIPSGLLGLTGIGYSFGNWFNNLLK